METLTFEKNRQKAAPYCPCGKSNRDGKFAPFEGHEKFGYCHSCDKTHKPNSDSTYTAPKPKPKPPQTRRYLRYELVEQSMRQGNNFTQHLHRLFGKETAEEVIQKYKIGTSKKWGGSCVFWYIDSRGNVRSGKIMGYDTNGKRIKHPPLVTWVHAELEIKPFKLYPSLYGEHLISDKPIAVVESEKTAVIASVYLPGFTWVATGCKGNISLQRFTALKGKKVVFFPDQGGFNEWTNAISTKLKGLNLNYTISDVMEHTDCHKGADIADLLETQSLSEFRPKEEEAKEPPQEAEDTPTLPGWKEEPLKTPVLEEWDIDDDDEWPQLPDWDIETEGLKSGNLSALWDVEAITTQLQLETLPQSLELSQGVYIANIPRFIESHLAIVKANNGQKAHLPYWNRLQAAAQLLNT